MQHKKAMKLNLFFVLILIPFVGFAQNYISYFTGNNTDFVANPSGGICLMGGATEDDNAMKWFLQRANGGDVLVLRASGSNGYNSYLYSDLGINVNSVETIVCNNTMASAEPYIIQKIRQAEAIWFAGGNQWNYINYWRNTAVDSAINEAIGQRNIVIGGTSAGMAIMGKYYFSAQNGTVTSATALSDPFNSLLRVDSAAFIANTYLNNTITDTHFDSPDRKGRLVTFMARIKQDYGVFASAIACDEYTAVCIDTNGIARVFGGDPAYDDNAYFIQSNCELNIQSPENCIQGNPLTWDLGGAAIKAYQIKGDNSGSKTFNLNNWQIVTGGNWYNWYVSNGSFFEQPADSIDCSPLTSVHSFEQSKLNIFPNPCTDRLYIINKQLSDVDYEIAFYNELGQKINLNISETGSEITLDTSTLAKGLYFVVNTEKSGLCSYFKIIKN